jgi:hypothetical protein
VNSTVEFAARSALIGVGATLVIDVWAAILRRLGVPSLNFRLLGRWLGHLPRGRWFHDSIATSAPIRGERWLGWCAHYGIGVSFAGLLLATFGLRWARSPTLPPALLIGVLTVVAPLFILQPAFGAGLASSKTSAPLFNTVKSLATHTVFGIGLFLAALAVAAILPSGY